LAEYRDSEGNKKYHINPQVARRMDHGGKDGEEPDGDEIPGKEFKLDRIHIEPADNGFSSEVSYCKDNPGKDESYDSRYHRIKKVHESPESVMEHLRPHLEHHVGRKAPNKSSTMAEAVPA
jgi:hypothetical protein